MTCEHCNGPGFGNGQCCWARAKEIANFKKKVFRTYILKVIFEMVISISSVVTDIITLIFYLKYEKWTLAVLSVIPVILPSTVFTNVYLTNKHQSYNRMSAQTMASGASSGVPTLIVEDENIPEETPAESSPYDQESCFNVRNCCRGCYQSCCHRDINIRKLGKRVVKKYMRKFAKYLFGTFVLRFIAWTWYLKALVFGYEAYREPKKYMKAATPDSHWSCELLTRLDFLQAALENAPQCVIQLYALLTDAGEERSLGVITLVLSFVDFVRVATTVQWSIAKGPVIAPKGCYGSGLWNVINTCSWILLYSARGCAIALLMATSQGVEVLFPVLGFVIHMVVFAKLFSSTKFGVAAQKVIVTAFISVFFLPDLSDSEHVDILIQFYYSALLLENTLFIIPWRGLEHVYCKLTLGSGGHSRTKLTVFENNTSETSGSECLISPVLIVLIVPAFTVLGIILRIATARRLASFKAANPEIEKPMTMEERVASIYNRKWTKLTYRDLFAAFVRMLRKEVKSQDSNSKNEEGNGTSVRSNSILLISGTLGEDLKASHTFIKKSFSMIVRCRDDPNELPIEQKDKILTFPRVKDSTLNPILVSEREGQRFQLDQDIDMKESLSNVPSYFYAPACIQNSTAAAPGSRIFRSLAVKYLTVESPEGDVLELDGK